MAHGRQNNLLIMCYHIFHKTKTFCTQTKHLLNTKLRYDDSEVDMMINRTEYHKIKKYIQSLCIDNVNDLALRVGLTEYETIILQNINQNNTRTFISLKLNVCESKVSKDLRKIFTKVNDYLKRNNLDI